MAKPVGPSRDGRRRRRRSETWNGTEVTGATAYDTAAVRPAVADFAPTGTVTYNFFTNSTCAGPGDDTRR